MPATLWSAFSYHFFLAYFFFVNTNYLEKYIFRLRMGSEIVNYINNIVINHFRPGTIDNNFCIFRNMIKHLKKARLIKKRNFFRQYYIVFKCIAILMFVLRSEERRVGNGVWCLGVAWLVS